MPRRPIIARAVDGLGFNLTVRNEILAEAERLARGDSRFSAVAAEDLAWKAARIVRRRRLASTGRDIAWDMTAPRPVGSIGGAP